MTAYMRNFLLHMGQSSEGVNDPEGEEIVNCKQLQQ